MKVYDDSLGISVTGIGTRLVGSWTVASRQPNKALQFRCNLGLFPHESNENDGEEHEDVVVHGLE